jgi:hypothetical protein
MRTEVIASAFRTEDHEFESSQGLFRFVDSTICSISALSKDFLFCLVSTCTLMQPRKWKDNKLHDSLTTVHRPKLWNVYSPKWRPADWRSRMAYVKLSDTLVNRKNLGPILQKLTELQRSGRKKKFFLHSLWWGPVQ